MSDDDSGTYQEQKNFNISHSRNMRKRTPNKPEEQEKSNEFFTGAVSARDGIYRPFPELRFIEGTEDRPAIVFPDGHIFIETFSPFYSKAIDFIIAISDPCSRPRYVHEYQINPYSLFAAVSIGLTADDIIKVLGYISKTPIHETLREHLRICCDAVGKLRLVLKEKRYFIESTQLGLLQDLLKKPIFAKARKKPQPDDVIYQNTGFILVDDEETEAIISGVGDAKFYGSTARLTEGIEELDTMSVYEPAPKQTLLRFELEENQVKDIRKYAVENNIFLTDEYDFTRDKSVPDLGIQLRPETSIRPYQEKALSKVFAGGRAKSGIIVLPCGAGKTLVGITAVTTVNKSAIVFCNSTEPVKQWEAQFKLWTKVNPKIVITLTKDHKVELPDGPCIVITTYGMMVASGHRADNTVKIMNQITSRDWGMMVLDEVQEASAAKSRLVASIVRAKTKLGLTATLVREDDKIDDLRYLVGPKLYEANWIELSELGFLARVRCFEVVCKMTAPFFKEYLASPDKRFLYAVGNPNKLMILESLMRYHDARGDKILIFCDYLPILKELGDKFKVYKLCGEVSDNERTKIFKQFKTTNKVNIIIISRIGDKAIDLPSANVLIQIAAHFGARLQESQRLGRILRPKPGRSGEYNAFFYTLVSEDTLEVKFSAKRQQFLVDQGYSYEPVTDATTRYEQFAMEHPGQPNPMERWKQLDNPIYADPAAQDAMMHLIRDTSAEEALPEEPPGMEYDEPTAGLSSGGSKSSRASYKSLM